MLGGKGAFSPSTDNGLVSAAGASGFPAVDVRRVSWLVSGVEIGFENLTFFFLEADVGVAQVEFFPDDILIGCRVRKYSFCIVDANVKRILPRKVVQTARVPMALVSRSLVEGCRQGAASVLTVSFRVDRPSTGNLPSMHDRSWYTSGTTSVPMCSPHLYYYRNSRYLAAADKKTSRYAV